MTAAEFRAQADFSAILADVQAAKLACETEMANLHAEAEGRSAAALPIRTAARLARLSDNLRAFDELIGALQRNMKESD
jgi:hypothetical protein